MAAADFRADPDGCPRDNSRDATFAPENARRSNATASKDAGQGSSLHRSYDPLRRVLTAVDSSCNRSRGDHSDRIAAAERAHFAHLPHRPSGARPSLPRNKAR